MKKGFFTALILGFAAVSHAQQKQTDTSAVKFTPPVIVKDGKKAESKTTEVVKFTPPVIVKDKPKKNRKAKNNEKVKFTPPVIVKDPVNKE
jgi:hypothetical protein